MPSTYEDEDINAFHISRSTSGRGRPSPFKKVIAIKIITFLSQIIDFFGFFAFYHIMNDSKRKNEDSFVLSE